MKQVVFDIEADGLTPTQVWCIVAKDVQTGQVSQFYGDTLMGFNDLVKGYDEVIGHNIIGYDVPVLERLLKTDFSHCKITDTLVLSRLANPQRGGHSLGDWGVTLGNQKAHHEDWTRFSSAMLDYCVQDVAVNELVYKRLLGELRNFGDQSQNNIPINYTITPTCGPNAGIPVSYSFIHTPNLAAGGTATATGSSGGCLPHG